MLKLTVHSNSQILIDRLPHPLPVVGYERHERDDRQASEGKPENRAISNDLALIYRQQIGRLVFIGFSSRGLFGTGHFVVANYLFLCSSLHHIAFIQEQHFGLHGLQF